MSSIPGHKPERLEARITAEQKEIIETAADLEGGTLSDFVIPMATIAAISGPRDEAEVGE